MPMAPDKSPPVFETVDPDEEADTVPGSQFRAVEFHISTWPLVGVVAATRFPCRPVTSKLGGEPKTSPPNAIQLTCVPLVPSKRSAFPVKAGKPPPLSTVQLFAAVQPYRFWPGAASLLKKLSPMAQVAGRIVPVLKGLVAAALEKSTPLVCDFRSTWVVCAAAGESAMQSEPAVVNTHVRRMVVNVLMAPWFGLEILKSPIETENQGPTKAYAHAKTAIPVSY